MHIKILLTSENDAKSSREPAAPRWLKKNAILRSARAVNVSGPACEDVRLKFSYKKITTRPVLGEKQAGY